MTDIERISKTAMMRKMKSDLISDLADRIGTKQPTIRKNLREPSGMPLGRFKAIAIESGMTKEEVYEAVMSVTAR